MNFKNGFHELGFYPNVKFKWGSVYRKNYKSCHLVINHFYIAGDDPVKKVKTHYRNIRQIVDRIVREGYFNKRYICIHDIPDSLVNTKSCFCEVELTLFIDDYIDKNDLINELEKFTNRIYVELFHKKNNFYRSLKELKDAKKQTA